MGNTKLDAALGVALLGIGGSVGFLYANTVESLLPAIAAIVIAAPLLAMTYGSLRASLAVPTGLTLGPVLNVGWIAIRDDMFDDERLWIAAAVPVVLVALWIAPGLRTAAIGAFVILCEACVHVALTFREDSSFPTLHLLLIVSGAVSLWFGSGSPAAAFRRVVQQQDGLLTTSAVPSSRLERADLAEEATEESGGGMPTIIIAGQPLWRIVVVLAVGGAALWGVGKVINGARDSVSESHQSIQQGVRP